MTRPVADRLSGPPSLIKGPNVPALYAQSAYPPAAVARAIAAISVALPGAPATARARLAAVLDACDTHDDWSDETRVALVRGATAWLALACLLSRSIRELQYMVATDLLDLLHAAHRVHDGTPPAVAEPSVEPVVVEHHAGLAGTARVPLL